MLLPSLLAPGGLKKGQDVMAATSFGGSFDSVRTNNNRLKDLFINHLKENALFTNLAFLKWLPFLEQKTLAELEQDDGCYCY